VARVSSTGRSRSSTKLANVLLGEVLGPVRLADDAYEVVAVDHWKPS